MSGEFDVVSQIKLSDNNDGVHCRSQSEYQCRKEGEG